LIGNGSDEIKFEDEEGIIVLVDDDGSVVCGVTKLLHTLLLSLTFNFYYDSFAAVVEID